MTEKRKILIVDDAEVMRKEIVNFLKVKYELYEAEDGLQALEQVQKVLPDMIILDLEMPVMGGFEFLDKVDEVLDSIPPVLILTSISTKRQETRKKGAQFYMDKPVDKDIIHKGIQNNSTKQVFRLEQNILVDEAELTNGILKIKLYKKDMHALPRKIIEIIEE